MAETSDKPIAELERDLGLSPGLIRKWQQRYRVCEDSTQFQASEESVAQAEIRRLKRELEVARQDCPLTPGTHVVVYCRDSGGEEQDRKYAKSKTPAA